MRQRVEFGQGQPPVRPTSVGWTLVAVFLGMGLLRALASLPPHHGHAAWSPPSDLELLFGRTFVTLLFLALLVVYVRGWRARRRSR